MEAYGITAGNVEGQLRNSGTLSLTVNASSHATAYGIEAREISGSLVNSGTIQMNVQGSSIAVNGIDLSSVSGFVSNSGTIAIRSDGSDARVDGIDAGNVTGRLQNSGNVSLSLTNATQGFAEGIDLGDVSGQVQNSGNLMVSVSATSSADAAGISASDVSGSLSNSGTVTIRAIGETSADADGIDLRNIDGTVSNSGTLSVLAQGSSAFAEGINTRDIAGTLNNTGSIQVMTIADSSANANGIDLSEISGNVTNSGSILVSAEGEYAYADGIEMDDVSGTFDNSGAISVQAIGNSSANATGLEIDDISGSVTNSGRIEISASNASATAYGAGIDVDDIEVGGTLSNSGTLVVNVETNNVFEVLAFGVDGSDVAGSFNNSGDISIALETQQATSAEAYGIDLSDIDATGSVTNSGSIQVAVTGQSVSGASAYGIDVTDVAGSFSNSGNITVALDLDGGSSAAALGLEPNDILAGGSVTNSGSIVVNTTTQNVFGTFALGIAASDVDGALENGGDIAVSAEGDNLAIAYGLGAGTLSSDAQVTHSGSIYVTANGADAEAYGLYVDAAQGTVNVTGDISATSSGEAFAVFLGDGGGTLNVETTADINGVIRVSDHDVTLTNVGGRVVYRFQDDDTSQGEFSTAVSNPNQAWFVDGEGGAAPVYASYSTEDSQPNTNQAFEIAGLSYDLAQQLNGSSSQNNTGERTVLSTRGSGPVEGFRPYALISGSQSDSDASSSTGDLSSNMWSVSAGLTRDLGTGLRYGFGASYLENNGTFGSASFDTTGFYLSGIVAQNFGFADVSFGLGYGNLDHTENRVVGGADTEADYSSELFTVLVAAQREYALQRGKVLTPRASFLYGQQDLDGYTETGSAANATVGERDVTFSETRLGGSYTMPVGGGTVSASLDAVHRDADAPSAIDVTIFGNTLLLASGGSGSETFGEISLGYNKAFDHGGTLNVQARSTLGADVSTQALWASYEWRF